MPRFALTFSYKPSRGTPHSCRNGFPKKHSTATNRHRIHIVTCIAHTHPNKQVVVVGGGAAGLTAAFFATRLPNVEVLILEKNEQAGRKILISGGTRCNVLPLHIDLDQDYFTESSKSALRAVFASWSLEQCRQWLEGNVQAGGLGLQLSLEESTCKYFPSSNSAQDVRDALLQGCLRAGAKIRYGSSLKSLQYTQALPHSAQSNEQQQGKWVVSCHDESAHTADAVVLATGGLSFPVLGASDAGSRVLQKLGHTLHPLYPALTPLTGKHPGAQQLAGLSLYDVQLRCEESNSTGDTPAAKRRKGPKKREAVRQSMLFTHRGYSGPAVLDLSHNMVMALERGTSLPTLYANWTQESQQQWEERLKAGGSGLVVNLLRKQGLPQRLAEALCHEVGISDRSVSELRREERQLLLKLLCSYPLECSGHEGYPKAEVTGGGIPLEQIDCSTLESRMTPPGCHICGELLDVHGRIGGFNFYWAWITGRIAGVAAAAGSVKRKASGGGKTGKRIGELGAAKNGVNGQDEASVHVAAAGADLQPDVAKVASKRRKRGPRT